MNTVTAGIVSSVARQVTVIGQTTTESTPLFVTLTLTLTRTLTIALTIALALTIGPTLSGFI